MAGSCTFHSFLSQIVVMCCQVNVDWKENCHIQRRTLTYYPHTLTQSLPWFECTNSRNPMNQRIKTNVITVQLLSHVDCTYNRSKEYWTDWRYIPTYSYFIYGCLWLVQLQQYPQNTYLSNVINVGNFLVKFNGISSTNQWYSVFCETKSSRFFFLRTSVFSHEKVSATKTHERSFSTQSSGSR